MRVILWIFLVLNMAAVVVNATCLSVMPNVVSALGLAFAVLGISTTSAALMIGRRHGDR